MLPTCCLYQRCGFLRKYRLPRSHPSSNRGSNTSVGSLGKLGGLFTLRLEQSHKQERHHTLTQNLKAVGLWVLLLITCSTFTILSDVGHITHTCKPTVIWCGRRFNCYCYEGEPYRAANVDVLIEEGHVRNTLDTLQVIRSVKSIAMDTLENGTSIKDLRDCL
ncbi:hypothetical protein MtrunA17_Chr6g0479381 [Medicago truncatula]|uniref:Uncharacterized protein n=1 Tax=Medicago truncatula TaxID=3880 RepID=A0A396HKD7_MEDTR|nr:hypothetical protein MtrunA17_Chr6g0479381 [Medicago truncatula]